MNRGYTEVDRVNDRCDDAYQCCRKLTNTMYGIGVIILIVLLMLWMLLSLVLTIVYASHAGYTDVILGYERSNFKPVIDQKRSTLKL